MNPPAMSTRCAVGAMLFLSASTVLADAPTAVIDAAKTSHPVNPHIYGQFIEHIAGIINNNLWAEMLDDRKFYYPVIESVPEESDTPGPPWRTRLRRWTAVGPPDAVVMDADHPYVGQHTPRVKLNGNQPRGITQSGLTVLKDKTYSGRVVLAGDPSAQVSVTLIWGPGSDDRRSVILGNLSDVYVKFPFTFTAGADSADAQLQITATGTGSFHIGAVSLMPADNLQGFRAEVVAALKQLNSGIYRFPGGNFVSAHEWRDAIGDPDKRPPIMDPVWNALQPNDVGTDEFISFCRLLEVEPYITVNAGFGDAHSASQLVEYANGNLSTPIGQLRAANGHPQPYNVRYWGIGNEMWGEWQFGVMPPNQYHVKHNLFARAMRAVDPSITLIASGAMPDTMTGSRQSLRLGDTLIPEPLSPADWTGGMFSACLDNMDMIAEHFYSYGNQRFDMDTGESVPVDPNEPLVEWMRRPANHIRAKVEAYEKYLQLIPALKDKPVPLSLSEWAYARVQPLGSYKVVPAYAWVFHEMFRHSDLYQMANFTFATAMVSSNRTDAVLSPAGLVFKLYANHFGSHPVEVTGDSPQPPPQYPVGGEQPAVNAGSPTFPLDVAAAWTADRSAFTIAVINPTESQQTLNLSVVNADLAAPGKRYQLAPSDLNAVNAPGQPPQVAIEESSVDEIPTTLTLPPWSVTLYQFSAK